MIGSHKYRLWLKHPGYNGKSDPPPAPDAKAAAEAEAAGNRISQYTPQGSVVYGEGPIDSQGNQTWNATVSYSPEQQQIYDQNVALTQGLLGTAQSGLGEVDKMLSNPAIDESKLASMPINPGESYMDAAMRFMQPQQDQQSEALRAQLANQGISIGTDAYTRATSDQADQFDRAKLQAIMLGMDKNLTARQQGIQEQNYINTYPLNIINALRTGNQVSNPSFVNTPAGPDYLGAAQAQYGAELGATNAQNAAFGNTMGGLFSLGSAAIQSPWLAAFSDRRLKRNIKRIGTHRLGIGVYEFDYIWGEHAVGVMADEVETVMPDAVITGPSGFKMVDYGRL